MTRRSLFTASLMILCVVLGGALIRSQELLAEYDRLLDRSQASTTACIDTLKKAVAKLEGLR